MSPVEDEIHLFARILMVFLNESLPLLPNQTSTWMCDVSAVSYCYSFF